MSAMADIQTETIIATIVDMLNEHIDFAKLRAESIVLGEYVEIPDITELLPCNIGNDLVEATLDEICNEFDLELISLGESYAIRVF